MNKTLYIISCIALCGTLYGKPIDQQIEKLPAEVQKHIDAIRLHAKSNDWASVQKEYDQINWREIKKPAKVLEIICKELKGNKDIKDLRKEIKTKYGLLREGDDADLDDDITETPIPVVTFAVQRFPATEIDKLELITIDVPSLESVRFPSTEIDKLELTTIDVLSLESVRFPSTEIDKLELTTIDVPSLEFVGHVDLSKYATEVVVLKVRDEKFLAKMALWEKRYGKVVDFWDDKGNKIVPARGSVLWRERKALMEAIEKGGDDDALWNAYNEHFIAAVGHRLNLKRHQRNIKHTPKGG